MCSEFVNLFMPLGCSMIMYATYFRCSITNAAFFFFHSFFVCRVILRIARSYRIRFDLTVAFVSLRGYSELGEGKLLYIFTSGWLDVFEEWGFWRFSMPNYWIRWCVLILSSWSFEQFLNLLLNRKELPTVVYELDGETCTNGHIFYPKHT